MNTVRGTCLEHHCTDIGINHAVDHRGTKYSTVKVFFFIEVVHGTESCGVNFVSESANTCVREHVTHSQPVYTLSKSAKRIRAGKQDSGTVVYIPSN